MVAVSDLIVSKFYTFNFEKQKLQPKIRYLPTLITPSYHFSIRLTASAFIGGKYFWPPGAFSKSFQKIQSFTLRVSIVAVQTFFALLFQGSFIEVADFIGATTMTVCCTILPIVFYLKIFAKQLSLSEKAFACLVVLLCTAMGVYTAVIRMGQAIDTIKGAEIFEAAVSTGGNATYPYCSAGYADRIAKFN